MISNAMARALRNLVPATEKFTALITLLPDGNTQVISADGCWWKPLDTKLDNYGGINLEGSERIINIPAEAVHCTGATTSEAREEIRRRDRIAVDGVTYIVLSSGLRSVSSRWECLVREIEA